MQLTLLTTFAQPSSAARPVSRGGPVPPSRESVAMSQLDRIAAQNLRGPTQGLGASGMLLALLGGLVVLGSASMWNGGNEPRVARAVPVAESQPAAATATAASPTPVAAPVIAAVPSGTATLQTTAPAVAPAAPEAEAVVVATAEHAAEDAARKARVKQLAEARRKAAQLAQERAAAAESERLQLAQQREAERAQQQQVAEQARQRVAAEQARLQTVQLALNTRRSVGESCSAAGGPIGRHLCSARECSKSEHQGDAVCMTLREDELTRQRASIER